MISIRYITNSILTLFLVLVIVSCKKHQFISRKYTPGNYHSQTSALKAVSKTTTDKSNTIHTDTITAHHLNKLLNRTYSYKPLSINPIKPLPISCCDSIFFSLGKVVTGKVTLITNTHVYYTIYGKNKIKNKRSITYDNIDHIRFENGATEYFKPFDSRSNPLLLDEYDEWFWLAVVGYISLSIIGGLIFWNGYIIIGAIIALFSLLSLLLICQHYENNIISMAFTAIGKFFGALILGAAAGIVGFAIIGIIVLLIVLAFTT